MRIRYWLGLTLFAICFVAVAFSVTAQDRAGLIRGVAIDENGVPIVGAKVNAELLDAHMRHTMVRYVETASDGRFTVDRLRWGTYKIVGMKEDAGYPNLTFAFYANGTSQIKTISPVEPIAEVIVRLGPKAALVEGSIMNSANGAPLNANIRLSRAAEPNKWFSASVSWHYKILLPSSIEVVMEISAPGFQTWTLPTPLKLASGEEMHLDAALESSHDPNLHPSKFLIPSGYVGWVLLHFNEKDAPLSPTEAGVQVFKFPPNGILTTSSCGPTEGAENGFFYYSEDGSFLPIPTDYRSGKGMVWGKHQGMTNGVISQFGFFVGTEEQYNKHKTQEARPGPLPAP